MTCTRILLCWLLLTLTCASMLTKAQAAELRLNVYRNYRSLDIEGRIEPGDYERFLRIVKESQAQLSSVYLYSPGGDFLEAIKIGRAIRALELSTRAPMRGRDGRPICEDPLGSKPRDPANCTAASAAFFIHIGGIGRHGTYLAVHRPFYDPQRFRNLSQSKALIAYERLLSEARAYMNEMALPSHIQEEVLNTPSDKHLVLDERVIRTHIWGDLPYRHEWLLAKCGNLSPTEDQRLITIGSRLAANQRLTPQESDELSRLRDMRDQQDRCGIQLIDESRKSAYERFFGVAPSDVGNHNFAKWLDAPKYLGHTFEDVTSEERFEPEKPLLGITSLTRKETATSPLASLMDIGNKRKIVSWVHIYKENPSDQFRQHLRSTLESAWGKPANDGNSLLWVSESFRANLTFEIFDPDHSSLSLIVKPLQE